MVGNTSPFHTCIIEEETMAKKKSKSRASAEKAKHQTDDEPEQGGGDASSDDSSSSDDDSLVLEGVLVRNPDVSDSDDDDDDDDISSEEEETESTKKKAKKPTTTDTNNSNNASKKQSNKQRQKQPPSNKKQKQKQSPPEPETVQVEFLFCDMHTRFFHGIKTLLHRYGVHAPHSSQLADLIIENDMVGTVLSTDLDHSPNVEDEKKPVKKQKKQPSADAKSTSSAAAAAASTSTAATTTSSYTPQEEANVFGFASIINFTTNHSNPCIQSLKSLILKHCPSQHKSEMTTVLSGNTARPVGFFFHERMVNVPLEITEVLHQQLILDMDYAINTADDEKERKSLDFGAFVRLAPCFYSREGGGGAAGGSGGGGGGVIYKYFDDEVFATNSEFVYNFEVAKHHNDDEDDGEKMGCSVIVLTKTGHRMAMKELKKMIHGG